MYIYNVTLNIENKIHAHWLNWIETHIMDVLNTGKFTSAKLTQVLVEDDNLTKTYSVQYTTENKEQLESFYKNNADMLHEKSLKKFGDSMLSFTTELKLINNFYPKN